MLRRGQEYLCLHGLYQSLGQGGVVSSSPTACSLGLRAHISGGVERVDGGRGEAHFTEFLLWLHQKYTVIEGGKQRAAYPRHVKGHITVFPNNVEEIATRVLPHPLLRIMDEIHVSWHGSAKPGPRDLSKLLSVRPRKVKEALVWLKRHNPLYKNISIDVEELESWGAITGV